MVNTIIQKENLDTNKYMEMAEWCNENGCMIKEYPEYFKVEKMDVNIKIDAEATNIKENLQEMAINAMMRMLTGNDITDDKYEYQTQLMSISDDVALKIPDVFPVWSGDSIEYKKDTKLTYNDVLYKVLQEHTSQASWTPDAAPSLFAKVLTSTDGQPSQWIQPDSTNPYMTGDKVIYNGHCYQSTIDNNVWAPDAYPDGWNMLY